jgi:hypothetical protein
VILLRSLVLSIALFAPPAFANGEFCDDQPRLPDDGGGTGPNGGNCETVFVYGAPAQASQPQVLPPRTLWFDEEVMRLLGAQPDAQSPDRVGISLDIVEPSFGPAQLPAQVGPDRVTMVEWSFVSADPTEGAYILVLALAKDEPDVVLKAEWRRSSGDPDPAPGSKATYESQLIDSRDVARAPLAKGQLPSLQLKWDQSTVSIAYKTTTATTQASTFALPPGAWAPARLRAGLLGGTALRQGTQMKLVWPGTLYEVGR